MLDFNDQAPAWNDMVPLSIQGAATQTQPDEVSMQTSDGSLCITAHACGFRMRFGACQFGDYGMLTNLMQTLPLTLHTGANASTLTAGDYRLRLTHQPFSFELDKAGRRVIASANDGHFARPARLPAAAKLAQGWFLALALDADEPVYGLGEKWSRLDKRGQFIKSCNHDALGVNAEISYKNTPFCWSPKGWGVFVHTPADVTHGVGFAPWSHRSYGLLVEDSSMDVFLLGGESGADMIADYTALTGRAPRPPLWSLGVILSKAYYQDADELLQAAQTVRDNHMPCDVMTLDGRAWQNTDTRFAFEWDASRYPDPAKIIDALKALHFKVCLWEYPLVSVLNPLFKTMADKGWLLKDRRTGEAYRYQWDQSPFGEVLVPLPESGLVDFTHPDAYAFWRDSHKPLFDLGVDMIKADFGEQVKADMLAYNGDSGTTLHNVYSLLYNRCVYEAAQKYSKTEPFLLSRCAWIGSQQYPAHWGGDPQADWGGLAASLRGGLSWGMSGAPFYATDIGGFYGDQRDAELYVRWTQAAVFSAHMRFHGIGQREPWSYGEAAGRAIAKALALRYRLIPYLQQAMDEAHETGLPVQRAMALAYPLERTAWAYEEQFMFGADLLVAPCIQAGGRVEVYLPQGTWYRFDSHQRYSHQRYAGGRSYKLDLALDEMAVFAPESAVIPLGTEVEHTDQMDQANPIQSHWAAGA